MSQKFQQEKGPAKMMTNYELYADRVIVGIKMHNP